MTPATKELIDATTGPLSLMGGFVETLNYGEPLHRGDESITLLPADHIVGAAQVLVEDNMGGRTVYTGDFKIEGTRAVDADVVVIEATYRSPACKRPFREEVKHILVSMVEERLKMALFKSLDITENFKRLCRYFAKTELMCPS